MPAEIVANCPRCKAQRITFDVLRHVVTKVENNWKTYYESFCFCRDCKKTTVFLFAATGPKENDHLTHVGGPSAYQGSISKLVTIEGHIGLKDAAGVQPPEHLPEDIRNVFAEGATCYAVKCHNAAATMFRLCVDLATGPLLPAEDLPGLNSKVRRDLGLRLPWLFDNGKLPPDLRGLSSCIHQDGNDGAHRGTLGEQDAQDLLDFTVALLERMFTEPKRVLLAEQRRQERRQPKA